MTTADNTNTNPVTESHYLHACALLKVVERDLRKYLHDPVDFGVQWVEYIHADLTEAMHLLQLQPIDTTDATTATYSHGNNGENNG